MSTSSSTGPAPSSWREHARVLGPALAAALAARIAFACLAPPEAHSADVENWTRVTRILAAGANPYAVTRPSCGCPFLPSSSACWQWGRASSRPSGKSRARRQVLRGDGRAQTELQQLHDVEMDGRLADVLHPVGSAVTDLHFPILVFRRFLLAVGVSELERSAVQCAHYAHWPLNAWSLVTGLEDRLIDPDLFIFRQLLDRGCPGLRFRLLLRHPGTLAGS